MFLRNYGVVVCGETIEEACYYLFNVVAACETQSKALVAGLDNIIIPNVELQRKLSELKLAQNDSITLLENKKWKTGELEFEALMRCLDNAVNRQSSYCFRPILLES
jgi:adducin